MRKALLASLALIIAPAAFASSGEGGGAAWTHWQPGNSLGDRASLQRGARNFMNYCQGCHSLKYLRYKRLGQDLAISEAALIAHLVPEGQKPTDYILTTMPAADSETWFGKTPPDLSLITRARGTDYVYRFLKTYYADPATPSGVNNLQLPTTAMPHVLSDLQGVPSAVFENGAFVKFEDGVPGRLSAADYDAFVRDTVNFLEYAGEPAKLTRMSLGIWVVLFLLAFTAIAWLLKQEYWKDVK